MQNVVKTLQKTTLSEIQLHALNQALEGFSHEQLFWASGYISGLCVDFSSAKIVSEESPDLTVLYASQGGNARSVAESIAADANKYGLSSQLISVDKYKPRNLAKEKYLLIVISTQGEGEPPETAQELFRYLSAKKKPKLENLQYAIFGLGDSSYQYFCKAAQDIDEYLQGAGAKAFAPRIDADLVYQAEAEKWGTEVLQKLEKIMPPKQTNVVALDKGKVSKKRHDSMNPYQAEVLENRCITSFDSVSDVHHIALEIDPDEINYQPGDAVGVFFKNDPELVTEILDTIHLSAEDKVNLNGTTLTISEALSEKLELTLLHPTVVKAWAGVSDDCKLKDICEDNNKLRVFANENQFIDLILAYPADIRADKLIELLLPLKPRLYSIASSQLAYEDEIHITVSTLQYQAFERSHIGGASGYLTQRITEGDLLSIYISENSGFKLPEDDVPVIMIGAGTGIAPFRGFLQERESRSSSGKNWLIFGNRHFYRDYLYQSEWLNYRKDGLLQRANVAFSRDDDERIYVQNRLQQEGKGIYNWLQEGAYIYVCGGIEMEKSISKSLKDIVKSHGDMSDDSAENFINTLRIQGRYSRDVY